MKLEQLPDDFTPQQFMQLDRESLEQIPYTRMKWFCVCKGCNNGTHIRDYGIGWYFLDRNSKNSWKNPRAYWRGRNDCYICSKHWLLWQRLEKKFDYDHIFRRLVGSYNEEQRRIPVTELKTIQKIEPK
jgi:hypothetical protein